MLLTKEVEVRACPTNYQHYIDLGYEIPMRKGHKKYNKEYVYNFNKPFIVKVEDLTNGSNATVEVLCDYCNKEILNMPYYKYIQSSKEIGKVACQKCASQKRKEVNLLRYGVDNYAKTDECKSKIAETMFERYGVDSYLKTEECQEKIKNTNIERYGKDYRSVFAKKARDTFYKKTGYDHPWKSQDVRRKTVETFMNKYGVNTPSKSPEVQEKMVRTMYENSSQRASRQQRYICDLYNGILNYPIRHYSADIYLPDCNLVIEYDGGGHTLSVVMGYKTEDEYLRHEIIRNNVIKREGYKQMRIISTKDLLPSDDVLLQMLEHTRKYFDTYPNHSWIEFNIDTSTVRNAEHKDGVFFDFGELRKIHQLDISDDDASA